MTASEIREFPHQDDSGRNRRSGWRIDCGISFFLALLTLVTYWPVLSCDFVNLDDPKYVSENPVVAAGLSPKALVYAWTTFDVGNWIPLTWMSFELEVSLFGLNAQVLHATNLFFHMANVVLVYLVLKRMTQAIGRSMAVALLFAVHPLHVESVAWISERKDVLSTFWLLLTLWSYEHYARAPGLRRMVMVCLLMCLGLLSKPMLVTLPILLLIMDVWPLQRVASVARQNRLGGVYPSRTFWELLAEKVPLLSLSLADGIVTILAQRSNDAMSVTDSSSVIIRLGNASYGSVWYLWKTACPTQLCAFYPLHLEGIPGKLVWISAIVLVSIGAYVVWQRRQRYLLFGWLWFFVSLLPVSGILQVGGQAYADRYSYVPHIGLFTVFVWEIDRWLTSCRLSRICGIGICGVLTVTFATMSWDQIGIWRNSDLLWQRALAIDPDNYGAHAMLASLRMQERDWDAAEQHVRRVLVLRPNFDRAIYQLGNIHLQRREWMLAEECMMWVLRNDPNHVAAARDLAALRPYLTATKSNKPARSNLNEEALILNRRGLANARKGEMQSALQCFEEAIARQADYADACNNAGLALCDLRRFDDAKKMFTQAITIEPENADFQINLAAMLASQEELPQALEHLSTALRLKPHDVETRIRLEQLKKKIAESR